MDTPSEQDAGATTTIQAVETQSRVSDTRDLAGERRKVRGSTSERAVGLSEPMTPRGLLLALSRRWKFALTIAVPASVIMFAVAGLLIPAHYTAYALLRIAEIEPRLVFKTAEGKSDFHTYRKTQIAMIKSSMVLNAALRMEGIAQLPLIRQHDDPVPWLKENLRVASYHSPEILQISIAGQQPEELAQIVNAVKDAYLDEVVNKERKERVARLSNLADIYQRTEEKVRLKEERVSKLAKQLGTGDSKALTIKQQMALEYFRELQREHTRARFDLMRAEVEGAAAGLNEVSDDISQAQESAQHEVARRERPKNTAQPDESLHYLPEGARVQLLARRIVQLRELIARYEQQVVNKDHPALNEYRSELARLEASAAELDVTSDAAFGPGLSSTTGISRSKRLELMRRQESTLREEVDKYSKLVKNIGESSYELELMQNEIAQISKVSERVGSEMEALRIELKSPSRVTLVQKAESPRTRDVTRKHRLMGAASAGTFGMVLMIIALNEFRVRRIGAPSDITDVLKVDVLGSLPALPRSLPLIGRRKAGERTALWNNALIESVDGIRSVLQHGSRGATSKVMMICSAAASEGKTTFACQLAGSLARSGKKTVLIDCDMRRPKSHTLLQTPLSPGLAELLGNDLDIDQVVHSTAEPNLWILPAGQISQASLATLARHGGKPILDVLRANFDQVIVDSAPILYVADTAAIARHIDSVVLVVRQNFSRLPLVSTACEKLGLLGVRLLGSVLVGVESSTHGYSYDYNFRKEPLT